MGPEALRRFGPFAVCCRIACGPTGVPGAGAPWRAGLLGVPVGGGPPASRPRRELRSARRLEARPGPVGQVARLSETAIAFARLYPCGTETVIAFAGTGRASTETVIAFARLYPCGIETAIAFAGAKWVFLVQFLGAEVMPVSRLPCWG